MAKSPDEMVSEDIVVAFRDKHLVPNDKLEGLAERIRGGRLRPQDWRSLAETETEEEGHAATH